MLDANDDSATAIAYMYRDAIVTPWYARRKTKGACIADRVTQSIVQLKCYSRYTLYNYVLLSHDHQTMGRNKRSTVAHMILWSDGLVEISF